MPIEFNCPSCGRRYAVADANAGKRFACKGCGTPNSVPGAAAPYGQAADPSKLQKRRMPNFVFIVAGALMLIGMALPWISLPDSVPAESRTQLAGYMSGFGIPIVMNDAAGQLSRKADGEAVSAEDRAQMRSVASTFKTLYLLYLIPLLAMLGLADELFSARRGRNRWWMRLMVTLAPAVALAIIIVAFSLLATVVDPGSNPQGGTHRPLNVFSLLGIGVYVLGLATLVSLFSIFTSPEAVIEKPHGPVQPPKPRPAEGAVRRPTSKVAARPISLPVTKAHPPSGEYASVRLPRKSGKLKPPADT
jgi:hypothetical protein